MKTILYGTDARKAILSGIEAVVECVAKTLGPKGRNVLLVRDLREPLSSRDGATVLRNITLDDDLLSVGCRLIQSVSLQQAAEAGDSTTSVAILTRAIATRACDVVDAGANPVVLKKEIEDAAALIQEKLTSWAKPLDDKSRLQVSFLSSNDALLGKLISDAFEQAGEYGLVGAEESQNVTSSIRVSEGMEIPAGYVSHLFVNEQEKGRTVLENPYILILDRKLSVLNPLVPLFSQIVQQGRSLLIIADEVDGDALKNLVVQSQKKVFPSCAIKPPLIGEYKKDLLEDIATVTGGTALLQETGMTDQLDRLELSDLGQAERIIVTRHKTQIIGGKGNQDRVTSRAKLITEQMAALMNDKNNRKHDIHRLEERLARLGGKIVLLSLGAATRIELDDLKLRAEDAIYAVRGAKEKGVIPGGGSSILRAGRVALIEKPSQGAAILADAVSTLFRTLCNNAGKTQEETNSMEIVLSPLAVKVGSPLADTHLDNIYDVRNDVWADPWESGVLDPLSVVSSCLANAVSVAGQVLLTESLVLNTTDDPMSMFKAGAAAGGK